MSTSTLPPGWVGKPEYHQTPGAFRVVRTFTLTTAWSSVANIGGIANDADVVALVARAGYDAAGVQQRAILKRVTVQNLDDGSDALVSEWATVGSAGEPAPTNAYGTAQVNGGVVTLDCSTIMQMRDVQAKMVEGTGTVTAIIWFDVPTAL